MAIEFPEKLNKDQAYKLGEFLSKYHKSFLIQCVRFAEASDYGRKCEYSEKALEVHFKLEHAKMMSDLRRVFE